MRGTENRLSSGPCSPHFIAELDGVLTAEVTNLKAVDLDPHCIRVVRIIVIVNQKRSAADVVTRVSVSAAQLDQRVFVVDLADRADGIRVVPPNDPPRPPNSRPSSRRAI